MGEAQPTSSVRVTKLTLNDAGYWEANVSINGTTRHFHRQHGSWRTNRKRSDDWPPGTTMREAPPAIARELQRRVRRAERSASRQGKALVAA